MARPVVTASAEDLYSRLGPWHRQAEEIGSATDRWDLLELCESIMGRLQEVQDIVRDSDDGPGWSNVLDVDRAPSGWLAWLAQFDGTRLEAGLDDDSQRARIKSTDGFKRGTPGAIVGAAQQYLTGTKTVFLIERHGSPWRLTVATMAGETPDPSAVERAVLAQKPVGIVLSVTIVAGGDFNTLRDTHTDFNDVTATFVNMAEIRVNPIKT